MKKSLLWIPIGVVVCLTLCFLLTKARTPAGRLPPRYFQVDGIEYLVDDSDPGRKLKHIENWGQITSTILDISGVEQDDQANFNCLGSRYMVVDGKMMIELDGKWYIGIPQERK